MKKALRVAGLLLVGAVIGLVGGIYLGYAYVGRPMQAWHALATAAWAGNIAQHQYENAGYTEAREALLHYIKVMKDLSSRPELELGRPAHTDMGLAYTRLALLSEANGNATEAHEFMQRAVDEARLGGWKEPSEEKLRSFVARIDRPRVAKPPGA